MRCAFEDGFDLVLGGEPTVKVLLSSFRFRDHDGAEHALTVDSELSGIAPALATRTVAHAYAWKSGQLEMIFTDSSRIVAEPDDNVESWEVSGPGDVFVVSPAGGGEPAVWPGAA